MNALATSSAKEEAKGPITRRIATLAMPARFALTVAGPVHAFVGVSTPVLALALSTLFEDYRWTWIAGLGVVLAVTGN